MRGSVCTQRWDPPSAKGLTFFAVHDVDSVRDEVREARLGRPSRKIVEEETFMNRKKAKIGGDFRYQYNLCYASKQMDQRAREICKRNQSPSDTYL